MRINRNTWIYLNNLKRGDILATIQTSIKTILVSQSVYVVTYYVNNAWKPESFVTLPALVEFDCITTKLSS